MAKLPRGLCTLISPHQHFWCLQQNDAWATGHQRADFTGMAGELQRVREEPREWGPSSQGKQLLFSQGEVHLMV